MTQRLLTIEQLEGIALVLENESCFYTTYMSMKAGTARAVREELRSQIRHFKASFDPAIRPLVMQPGYDWNHDREILRRYFDQRYGIEVRPADEFQSSRETTNADLPRLFRDSDPRPTPVDNDQPHQPPETPKEPIMSSPIQVTTKTLVNGQDVANMSDASIYELIAAQEAKIKELEAIENKPKKLTAEIAKRKEGIAALVAHLDAQA